ncbi:uncharacterized protein LOC127852538 [Dreissena polymorpha]|uniref:uncharacterized protein LOC127852538 n=1 Tax=Dreissena polymorpha TaxID=45954 RepID=UPI0022656298|nr:uncharacterized protein LOC127852538 [Dreissena polymorpha]
MSDIVAGLLLRNIPSELIKHGGEATTTACTVQCQRILGEKKWPKEWTQSLVIQLPKNGNLKLYESHRIKDFDRVWHDGLWYVIRRFHIDEGLKQVIQDFYGNASNTVLLSGQQGDFFRTSVGVLQGCLLSLVLLNLFIEKII